MWSPSLQYYLALETYKQTQAFYKAYDLDVPPPKRKDFKCAECGTVTCKHDDMEG